ncbi:MAG: DNA adenine methylase [Sphingobium sp.]
MTASPTRPLLRWHGGKWLLAPWIIGHFPPHRIYVEPFGGVASVLLRKERAYAEVYNDLDEGVVNLMALLRNGHGETLAAKLRLTPFSRVEFERAYLPSDDIFESARRLIVRCFMGFGSDGHNTGNGRTGFRATSNKSGTIPAHDWANYPDALLLVAQRMQGVVVERRPAIDIMRQHDTPSTLHYVDPPYLPETRTARKRGDKCHAYRHEMTADDHRELLAVLRGLDGMVILSGYPSTLYDDALPAWRRVERKALADGARDRTEVLWINPAAASALGSGPLFEAAA